MAVISSPAPANVQIHLRYYGPYDFPVGSVKKNGAPDIPVRRRVRLHDQPTGALVRETWSDPSTGAYGFENVREGVYYVLSIDHTGEYGGVIETDIVVGPGV